ncbi:preprotein translocase subunit SecE [Clostridium acidisoli DSM 12555]|uniref:Protein translocase subunit SecE n=1 Tax=Clostridium acidisoli DSM 12555 TaxID=1121291 RepID=A0A1W1XZ01_9CLOT|nr:preprotein translocase subunit SecE [Clostridium acidisoli]SMC29143.1 preprotein translocase subunit SecE [Clostridium acidisoli DSM 12555]
MADNGKIEEMKESPSKGLIGFFKELRAEIHRITWPSKIDTKKATISVTVFCVIYIVIIAILDFGFDNLFKVIFK